jgi:hypothetical protein
MYGNHEFCLGLHRTGEVVVLSPNVGNFKYFATQRNLAANASAVGDSSMFRRRSGKGPEVQSLLRLIHPINPNPMKVRNFSVQQLANCRNSLPAL